MYSGVACYCKQLGLNSTCKFQGSLQDMPQNCPAKAPET